MPTRSWDQLCPPGNEENSSACLDPWHAIPCILISYRTSGNLVTGKLKTLNYDSWYQRFIVTIQKHSEIHSLTAHTHASPTQFYGVCQESGVLAVHSDSVKLGTKSGHNDARDFFGFTSVPVAAWPGETNQVWTRWIWCRNNTWAWAGCPTWLIRFL